MSLKSKRNSKAALKQLSGLRKALSLNPESEPLTESDANDVSQMAEDS